MKRKPNNWDASADYGSDILGVGSYTNLPPSGTSKKKTQIGFVRTERPKRQANKRTKTK